MKAVWFCFLLSLYVAVAVPLNEIEKDVNMENDARNALIEGIINAMIEDLRDTILNGSENIPVLDPFVLDELHLDDETIPLPGVKFSIADTTVRNLGAFIIDRLSVSTSWIINNRVNLDAHIPVIDIDSGFYDLAVDALGYSIFGTGTAKIHIVNPSITADLNVRLGIPITVPECTVHFSLGAFESQITGMFGHEGASEFVSLFLNNLIPELVIMYENEISEVLSEFVKNFVENSF